MKKVVVALVLLISTITFAEKPVSLNIFDNVQVPGDNSTSIKGIRFNLFYGVNQNLTGFDFPISPIQINVIRGDMTGVQLSPIYNQVDGNMKGFQAAVVNNSGNVTGVQMGLVNIAQSLKGLQIGLLNFNKAGTAIPKGFSSPAFFPIVNWSF